MIPPDLPQEPFGCRGCWPADAAAAWEARGFLDSHAELIDDSHLGVRILTCADCGQRFVSFFLEIVDWADGDDSQYWTLMPLKGAEVEGLSELNEAALAGRLNSVAPGRRSLQRDYPKGEAPRVYWKTGIHIVG